MIKRNRRQLNSQKKPASLNLVSLMDIFTILVFFLMVNANEVEVLETSSDIKLPDSTSLTAPEDRLVISVSQTMLKIGAESIPLPDIINLNDGTTLPALASLLAVHANAEKDKLQEGATFQGEVTILGDKGLPYEWLKKIMRTCQEASYTRIALAVNQVPTEVATR